jgi:hypothetical protein
MRAALLFLFLFLFLFLRPPPPGHRCCPVAGGRPCLVSVCQESRVKSQDGSVCFRLRLNCGATWHVSLEACLPVVLLLYVYVIRHVGVTSYRRYLVIAHMESL